MVALLAITTSIGAPITALVFSPDGSILASSGYKRVDLRSPRTGEIRESIPCDFPRVTSITFASEGLLVVGGGFPGRSGQVTIFEMKSNAIKSRIVGKKDLV